MTTALLTRPLCIGPIELASPFLQAALSGYSDWPMRMVSRRHGAAYALCEVMLDQFLVSVRNSRKNRRFLMLSDDDHPVGGQLMGADPEHFGPAALRLVQSGFDVIDINFGCPVKKVLGRCRGGFHLSQPAVALEIVSRVRDAVPAHIPVTLKMRRGLDDSESSRDRFYEIFDGAFERGAAAITVHGRTVVQRYDGPSNWNFLRDVKRHAGAKTVFGSGDLFTAGDCVRMLAETGVDGVTIARGSIGNPWIFSQCLAMAGGLPCPAPPGIHEQRSVLREHFARSAEMYGDDRCGVQMRKFGIKYARLHPEQAEVRGAFVAMKTPGDFENVLDRWYAVDGAGCFPHADEVEACGDHASG